MTIDGHESAARDSWPTGSVEERVQMAITEVRPGVQADGGDVELVRVDGATVYLRLSGACTGCPMASSTLADFVGERIRLYAPEIRNVVTE